MVAAANAESRASATAAGDTRDEALARWKGWWLEAESATALEVLARMPGADLAATTPKPPWRPRTLEWAPAAERDPGGRTAAALAAARNDAEAVGLLARLGVPLATRDGAGDTPLLLAAKRGHAEAVAALLAAGADAVALEARDDASCATAAFCAADAGHGDVAVALLRAGASPAARSADDRTLLDACFGVPRKEERARAVVEVLSRLGPAGAMGDVKVGSKHFRAQQRALERKLRRLRLEDLLRVAAVWGVTPPAANMGAVGDDGAERDAVEVLAARLAASVTGGRS